MAKKSITGIKEFKRDLEEMDKKLQTKTIKTSQKKAMKTLATEIKSAAPVGDTGSLKKGVKVKAGGRRKGKIITVVEVSSDDPHVGFNELGRRGVPANPFIRNSTKRKTEDIINTLVDAISEAIKNV